MKRLSMANFLTEFSQRPCTKEESTATCFLLNIDGRILLKFSEAYRVRRYILQFLFIRYRSSDSLNDTVMADVSAICTGLYVCTSDAKVARKKKKSWKISALDFPFSLPFVFLSRKGCDCLRSNLLPPG